MYNIWFWVIIGILSFNFLLGLWLNLLNASSLSEDLPDEVSDIYEAEKYAKSQKYTRENIRFALITKTFSFIVIMLMLFFRGFAFFDELAVKLVGEGVIKTALVFFLLLYLINEVISLPFDIYDTFVIEKKYGFNKTTRSVFIGDKIKSLFLTIIIGGLLLWAMLYFYNITQKNFWIYAWILISFFSIFMAMFYSNLIVPLFNKQTPLEEGELRTAIQDFAQKAGFDLQNIYVIDGSKRSTKANAYFTGLGNKKRIVLYDTLIQQLTVDEIVAVLAHEIGHYKHKHIIRSLIVSLLNTGLVLYIFSLIVSYPQFSEVLGVQGIKFHIALITFGLLYSPISLITGLIMNIFSRKNEFQADNFAKKYGLANSLISGLKKLSVNSLSNLTPHKIYVFFNYSHPTLLERIKNLKK
jgi:STE24 endopeptidase